MEQSTKGRSVRRTSGAKEEAADIKRPLQRSRIPCIAATLGFLVPGLGHVYAGRPRQGALWYVAAFMFPLVLALAGLQFSFRGLVLFLSLEIVVAAVIIVDSARAARRQGTVTLAPWQRWWAYGLIIFLAFALSLVTQFTVERKALGIRAFKIPSESMEPGLLVGDHVVTDIRAYSSELPSRGDIVVFRHPDQPNIFYIKRVAAVGGDTVALRGNGLYVNGKAVDEPYVRNDSDTQGLETKAFGPITVERGKLFVLGDNRDHSYDSRRWGTVDVGNLVGKALYIYWSWDAMQKTPRMDRIGMEIK